MKRTAINERCPVCDRKPAPPDAYWPVWRGELSLDGVHCYVTLKYKPSFVSECRCHAVDWRTRCLAAEAGLLVSEAAADRYESALTKISAIRDSIVGCQNFNWSEHAYPLVAVLEEAGFPGVGYEIASKNIGTLIDQANAARAERDEARAEADAAMWAHAVSDSLFMAACRAPDVSAELLLRATYPQHAERLIAERAKTDAD